MCSSAIILVFYNIFSGLFENNSFAFKLKIHLAKRRNYFKLIAMAIAFLTAQTTDKGTFHISECCWLSHSLSPPSFCLSVSLWNVSGLPSRITHCDFSILAVKICLFVCRILSLPFFFFGFMCSHFFFISQRASVALPAAVASRTLLNTLLVYLQATFCNNFYCFLPTSSPRVGFERLLVLSWQQETMI